MFKLALIEADETNFEEDIHLVIKCDDQIIANVYYNNLDPKKNYLCVDFVARDPFDSFLHALACVTATMQKNRLAEAENFVEIFYRDLDVTKEMIELDLIFV